MTYVIHEIVNSDSFSYSIRSPEKQYEQHWTLKLTEFTSRAKVQIRLLCMLCIFLCDWLGMENLSLLVPPHCEFPEFQSLK